MSGWEPREYVTYVFDGDRVVGEERVREPEWSVTDGDMVLAQMLWEQSLNPLGFPTDEATSDEARETNYEGAFYYRRVETPVIDWAMKLSKDWEDEYRREHPDWDMNGLIFPVEKVSRPPRAQ